MRGIIFCKNLEQGNQQLLDIEKKYKFIKIDTQLKKLEKGYSLMCDNGDYWTVISSSSTARGLRCNIAYIERNIDIDTYYTVIIPCLTSLPYTAIHLFGEGKLRINEQPLVSFN